MTSQNKHVLSLISAIILLIIDAMSWSPSISGFNELITFILSFFISSIVYYLLVRGVVELLDWIGG